jgi:type VI secretion system protein ImpH
MAGSHRTSTQGLELRRELTEKPHRYEFYQALRLLEALHPDAPRIGRGARASQELALFGQEPDLAFPTSMLAGFASGGEARRDRLDVRFFGLFGPNGPLPLHLTEYARDRDRHEKDSSFRRFADIFHHRMLSLFYRAWANAQPTVSYDRPSEDRFVDYVGSFVGIGLPGAHDQDLLPDHSRLYLAGLLAMQHRPADGLEALVEEYLQEPAEVDEFVGEWLPLPADAVSSLGRSPLSSVLGENLTIGEKTWFCQGRVRVTCGPLSFPSFRNLLPDRQSLTRLDCLVKSYLGLETAWELSLVLKAEEVPSVSLGESGHLGWTSWLGHRDPRSNAADVVLHPDRLGVSPAITGALTAASESERYEENHHG